MPQSGMAPDPRALTRYRRLALRTTETFEGGIYPFPLFVPDAGGQLQRGRGVVWRSRRTNLLWTESEDRAGTAGPELAVTALLHFVKKHDRELMGRPARFELADAALADAFREQLGDGEAEVVAVPALAEVDEALRELTRTVDDVDGSTRLVDAPGVTADQVQAFAAAAAACYTAAPWNGLASTDVIVVDGAGLPPDMRAVVITSEPAGLLLFAGEEDARDFLAGEEGEQIDPWSIAFVDINGLSFTDATEWHARGLAVAGTDAYPRVYGPGDEATAPTPEHIAGLTLVLGAVAASRDDDLDGGEWTCDVALAGRTVRVSLSLPGLLEPVPPGEPDPDVDVSLWMRVQEEREGLGLAGPLPDEAPAETQARALALEAMATTGRRQLQLARRAVAVDPACADALRVLAIRTVDLDAAMPLYRQALAAAEASRPASASADVGVPSWDDLSARPYIRARLALGSALDAAERFDEARQQFEGLVDPDPGRESIARDLLLETLVRAGATGEAQALVERFAADPRAVWAYAAALVAFWREGDGASARALLARAVAANVHAVPYLTGARDFDEPGGSLGPGSEDEGADIADRLIDLWHEVPGALAWLEKMAPSRKRRRR